MKQKLMILGSFMLFVSLFTTASPLSPLMREHVHSIVQRPDGLFTVTCLDGTEEVRTEKQVMANFLCLHLRTESSNWEIQKDQTKCNLRLSLVHSEDRIFILSGQFIPPCERSDFRTDQCQGGHCMVNRGGELLEFDFSIPGRLAVRAENDQSESIYFGNSGMAYRHGLIRLVNLGGVPRILQTSLDGEDWRSVCDDGVGPHEAEVACRQLGFSGKVASLVTAVNVDQDFEFGLDQLKCLGSESSLMDCEHNPWRNDDCGPGEHVQLICEP